MIYDTFDANPFTKTDYNDFNFLLGLTIWTKIGEGQTMGKIEIMWFVYVGTYKHLFICLFLVYVVCWNTVILKESTKS